MKVFIITHAPYPKGMAETNRITCYSKACSKLGVDSDVIIYVRPGIDDIPDNGNNEGIKYRYTTTGKHYSPNTIVKKIQELRDSIRLWRYVLKNVHKGDVVFTYGQFILPIVPLLIKLKQAYLVKEVCEYLFLNEETSWKVRVSKLLQIHFTYPLYDGAVAISDALVQFSKDLFSSRCKIIKVPILVEFDKYEIEDKASQSENPYIFHAGSLYESKDGIVGMIRAFAKAHEKCPGLKFISTGLLDKSPHKKEIVEIIDKYELQSSITFLGYIETDTLKEYLSKASIVIINKYITKQNTYCFSTKLAEYMAASKAIIITRVGEAMNWLTPSEDALIIEPSNNDELAEAIVSLAGDSQLRHRLGMNAHNKCQKSFDYQIWAETLVDYFNSFK